MIIFRPWRCAVALEVGHARHRAVVVHDLADHAGRVQAGQPREVDRRLGLAGALEHAAGLGLEREDVAGLDEVARRRLRVDRDLDRARAVGGRDAGGDAVARLDRDGERRSRTATRSWPPSGRARARRSAAGVSARQISPRPSLAMKLIASGVANWAASVRSPSFSRSSSSQTTTIRPARMSSIASSTVANLLIAPAPVVRCTWRARPPPGSPASRSSPHRGSSAPASRGSARPGTSRRRGRTTVSDTPSTAIEPFSTT